MFLLKNMKNKAAELYQYRGVIHSLVYRNLFGKYRNSILGFAWNFITPAILMLMYYVLFNELVVGEEIENRGIFISVAIFAFHYLTSCIVGGTNAFTGNANMLKKMYLPKEVLVLSKAISSMIICVIGYCIVLSVLLITAYPVDLYCLLMLPVILLFVFLFGIGCIFFLSTVAVYVRDIQYALGPLGIAFFVLTPMRYMASDAQGIIGEIIWINPLTYYVESLHDILYWSMMTSSYNLIMCSLLSVLALFIGYILFRKMKHGFMKRL